jgi:hypothetical protein
VMAGHSVERWDGLRLWVYRTRDGSMPCAVIMRRTRGARQDDTLLGRSNIEPHIAQLAHQDPYLALLAGLLQLRGAVVLNNQLMSILRAERPASPVGDHGGTEDMLDTQGRIKIESPPPP